VSGCDGGYDPPPSTDLEIWDWYDLDDVRDNMYGDHVLMNDLDSSTPGYDQLGGPTANGGKGWEPIIEILYAGEYVMGFKGTFDGQGHEICDLFIDRPGEDYTGLFGFIDGGGVAHDIGVVNATVIGADYVGSLVGLNNGNVTNALSTGSVTGSDSVGGLAGQNYNGIVSNSRSSCSVAGDENVGGLMGCNVYPPSTFPIKAIVHNSYSTGSVTGDRWVGGLVGRNSGAVSNSHSTGSVNGNEWVGGLVGLNHKGTVNDSYSVGSVSGTTGVGGVVGVNSHYDDSTVSNCHYNYDEVLINGENIITRGALFGDDFEQWLDNDKFLDIGQRLSQDNGYYLVNNITDFKQLLAFGGNATLRFRLESDLDLGDEPSFYIPYLAGEFDGDNHEISNLSFSFGFVYDVGLFGYVGPGGNVIDLAAENVNITGDKSVGGLVGFSAGTVHDSSSTGGVTGQGFVGGLVGYIWSSGVVSNSSFVGTVTGDRNVGGLAGRNLGSVTDSYSDGDVQGISGSAGGLVGDNGGIAANSHSTASVTGDNNIGGLVGQNDADSTVINCHASGDVVADHVVGGLLGANYGDVSSSYSAGTVTGNERVGGLAGGNGCDGTMSNCYSSSSVTGNEQVGGLLGENSNGSVSHSYSAGSVSGSSYVGGLVGYGEGANNVTNCFWDTQTSGQSTSDGGTGKTTAQMKNVATFSGVGWDIITVASPGTRNPSYVWNIVDNETYPFLSWQS
jgi:hypothetical protein